MYIFYIHLLKGAKMKTNTLVSKLFRRQLIYFFYFIVMSHSSITKLMEPKTPSWFVDQFKNTIINLIPELVPSSFYLIGIFELTIGILFLSCVFLKNNKQLFVSKLAFSFVLVLFIMLSFGQRISGNFQDSAILFFYFTASLYLESFVSESC